MFGTASIGAGAAIALASGSSPDLAIALEIGKLAAAATLLGFLLTGPFGALLERRKRPSV